MPRLMTSVTVHEKLYKLKGDVKHSSAIDLGYIILALLPPDEGLTLLKEVYELVSTNVADPELIKEILPLLQIMINFQEIKVKKFFSATPQP